MAIISGMEAAKVDDVKPFELPVDALADGIKTRQGRYDAAKDLNAKGAAAIMFDVRDREEDYAERQKVIDEYNNRINALSESVGGDWSLIDNSQIQAEALRSAQDKRVGHLKMAKKQADDYEKLVKEIEKSHGFAERFGEDANTQSLYDEKGGLRDLEQWSVQAKLDHVKAAHDYYLNIGTTLRSKFELIHSTDPEYVKLSPEQKEKLWYDFWVNKHTDKETNIFQINQIKDFLVDDYKSTDAGKQYYNILIRNAISAGQPADLAKKYADDAIFTLVQQIGASKYIDKETVKATMQTNTKPAEPSYGGGGGNKGNGNGSKEEKKVYNIEKGVSSSADVTDEGYTYERASAYDQAMSILDKNFNIQTLPKDFAYGDVQNVYASADASVIVPHRSDEMRGGIAKNVRGTVYQFGDGSLSNLKDGKNGGNLAAVRIGDGLPIVLLATGAAVMGHNQNYKEHLKNEIKKYQEEPDASGIIAFNKDDLNSAVDLMLEDRLKKDKNYAAIKDEEAKKKYKQSLREQLLGGFIGTDGDMAPAYKATYDEVKGYATYSMRDEYNYVRKAFDKEEKALMDNKLMDPETKSLRFAYLKTRRENFENKITDSEGKLRLLNTTMGDVYENPNSSFTEEELGFIKNMEGLRNHSKSLKLTAENLLLLDRTLAKSVGMTDKEYDEHVNINGKNPEALRNRNEAAEAKLKAMTSAFSTEPWYGGNLASELADLTTNQYKNVKTNVVNFLEKFLQGSINIEELNAIPNDISLIDQDSANSKKLGKISALILLKSGFKIEDNLTILGGGRDGAYQFIDIQTHLDKFEETYFAKEADGSLILKPNIDFGKINNTYVGELKSEIQKSKCNNKYKEYLSKTIESKQVTTASYSGKRFAFNTESAIGKELQGVVTLQAKNEFKAAIGTGIAGKGIKWKRAVYNNKGIPEYVDLNSEEIKTALRSANVSYTTNAEGEIVLDTEGSANSLQQMIDKSNQVYIRPDYNNDVSESANGTYSGSFINADIGLDYIDPKTGATTTLWIEIPIPTISQEMALMVGMDNVVVEYGQQVAASRTKSQNTMIELTVPSTKHTANPVTKQFQVLHFETTIAGVKYPRGSIVSLNNYVNGMPLSQQYENLKAGDFTIYSNEDELIKAFHAEKSSANEQLKFALTRINKYQSEYGNLAKENPEKFEAVFRRNEGDPAFEAYKKAGGFQGMKATAAKMINEKAYAADPNKLSGTENPDKNRSLSYNPVTSKKVIINTKTGAPITKEELSKTSNVELRHWINQAGEQSKNPAKVKPILEVIDKNINGDLDTKHDDGNIYMFSKDSKNHTKVGDDSKTLSGKNEAEGKGGFYSLYEFEQKLDPLEKNMEGVETKVKPVVIAKKGVNSFLRNDANDAFKNVFSHLDLNRDLKGAPLEVTSGVRSINNNLGQYIHDIESFTNSEHLYGSAIDISTARLGNTPDESSGYAFLRWAEANRDILKRNGVRIVHHAVEKQEYHIHMEYVGKDDSRAGEIIIK